MNIEVESAGKNRTRALDLPYAAFVITTKDIQVSGAQSIPDALRLAPGLLVGQISAGEWGVSIRGLGGRFSRFVLVMVDGRIAYNSAFSGVNWDELNITLSEIDRIEVIRGPNAAAWGANAVNGIINIITRAADAGEGSRVKVWAGSAGHAGQSVGANFAGSGGWSWRVSEHVNQWDGLSTPDGSFQEDPHRDWRVATVLKHQGEDDNLVLQFAGFGSEQSPEWAWIDEATLSRKSRETEESKLGWVAQFKYERRLAENTVWNTRFSFDTTERENRLFNWDSLNYQFDTEISANWGRHELAAGLNTRYTESDIRSADFFSMKLAPTQRSFSQYGIYLSDIWRATDELSLTLAARLDRSQLSDTNAQPSARILWAPTERDRFWVAWSEASSTPSRALLDLDEVPYAIIPANAPEQPFPVLLVLEGHTGEERDVTLEATELGYRRTFESFSLDATVFDFAYSGEASVVTSGEPEIVFADIFTPWYIRQRGFFVNERELDSQGAELSVRAQPVRSWSSQLAYTWLEIDKPGDNSTTAVSFLNSVVLSEALSLNINVRYVHGIDYTSSRYTAEFEGTDLKESYTAVDLNLNWNVNESTTIALLLNNLGEEHGEIVREEFTTRALQTEPYALLKLTYTR